MKLSHLLRIAAVSLAALLVPVSAMADAGPKDVSKDPGASVSQPTKRARIVRVQKGDAKAQKGRDAQPGRSKVVRPRVAGAKAGDAKPKTRRVIIKRAAAPGGG